MSNTTENNVNSGRRYQQAMPKINLSMGTRLLIKLSPMASDAAKALEAEYIGGIHYHFLIIKLPSIPGLRNFLLPRTLMEIQYEFNGSVCSFYAEIMAHSMRPTMMCFVTYPDRLNVLEIRQHSRVSCALPCSLHSAQGKFKGIISDISKGGCKVLLPAAGNSIAKNIEPNTSAVLRTILSPDSEAASVATKIKAIEGEGHKISLGIGFEDNKKFQDELESYMSIMSKIIF